MIPADPKTRCACGALASLPHDCSAKTSARAAKEPSNQERLAELPSGAVPTGTRCACGALYGQPHACDERRALLPDPEPAVEDPVVERDDVFVDIPVPSPWIIRGKRRVILDKPRETDVAKDGGES